VELQLPSTHEWSGTYWYWDYVMTMKIMTEGSLREAKEQLEAVKAQMEVHCSYTFFCLTMKTRDILCRPLLRPRVKAKEKGGGVVWCLIIHAAGF